MTTGMTRVLKFGVVAMLLVVASACATTGSSGVDRSQISMEELDEVQASNLYVAVQRLRPNWLRTRDLQGTGGGGGGVAVVADGSVIGSAEALRQYPVDYAVWLQYMDASQASSRYRGVGDASGVIIIHRSAPDS